MTRNCRRSVVAPILGLARSGRVPRALPWAGLLRAFGPWRRRRKPSENRPAHTSRRDGRDFPRPLLPPLRGVAVGGCVRGFRYAPPPATFGLALRANFGQGLRADFGQGFRANFGPALLPPLRGEAVGGCVRGFRYAPPPANFGLALRATFGQALRASFGRALRASFGQGLRASFGQGLRANFEQALWVNFGQGLRASCSRRVHYCHGLGAISGALL
jgi:hypothetical protein